MIRVLALALGLLAGLPATALDSSLRPVARGELAQSQDIRLRPPAQRSLALTLSAPHLRPVPRPYSRPDLVQVSAASPWTRAEQNLFAFSPTAPALSLRPTGRSAAFIQIMADKQAAIARGSVCGDPAIQGQAIGAVPGRGQCGIGNAVQINSVAGVRLIPAARMDCTTANALKQWVENGVKPATDNQAISMRVIGGYSCRFRNGAASGKLSEHAFGRAIDIAGIGLKSGREMTLLTGWNTQRDGPALRQMWRAACGPFGTVLGPESNRFHRDHFHFDTARYRSGSYCR